MKALMLRGIAKTYDTSPPVHALVDVDFEAALGEKVAILGRSGAGKSTLLNIVGLLDAPTRGSYELLGTPTEVLTPRERDLLRARALGFVFQDYHVLGHRTVAENVELKLVIAGVPSSEREFLVSRALARVGLGHRLGALGRLLSGGEKQRLAVARAVVTAPRILLADEPTGNLDDQSAENVLSLFDDQVREGVTVIVITHDSRLADWADRAVMLDGGRMSLRAAG